MQRGSRDERGFTMVEMIITIAIMAILAGIIGGAYSIHAGRKHDQEGNNLFVFI